MLLRSVFRFHAYFHVQITLHHLGISLPHEDVFSKVKNSYDKSTYYSICDDYSINAGEIWLHGDWIYTTKCGIFGNGGKATKRSPQTTLHNG